MSPSARDNRQWVKDRVARAGLTEEVEMTALAVAVLIAELEEPGTERSWQR